MHEPGWESMHGSLEQALFDRRVMIVGGEVDLTRAGQLAASLMTLDALGDDPVELRLSAESDSLDVAFCLIDTIDVLGVAINATVAGSVGGTMAGVLAVCRHRRIGAHGHIHLREPRSEVQGHADDIWRHATDIGTRMQRYCHRLASATNRPFEYVEAELRVGLHLDAGSALAYGLVDEIIDKAPP